MRKPQSIHSILEQTLKALEIDIPIRTHSIMSAWKEIVGESVAAHSQPRSIRNQILFIDVIHPTWMQQLQFLKSVLLEKVNAYLREPLIQDIRFKLGKIAPPPPLSKPETWQKEDLDEATRKRIEALLQKIEDGEIRRILKNVLIGGAKLEQSRKKSK
jgi:hypothetical protein